MSVFGSLLQSRKFWLMIIDVVVSVATYFVVKYVAPEIAKDVMFLIGVMQPVVIALIVGIAVEDAAVKGSGNVVREAECVCGEECQ